MKYFYSIIISYLIIIPNFGNENIFQKDLKYLIQNHPSIKTEYLNYLSKQKTAEYRERYYPDPMLVIAARNVPYNKNLKLDYEKESMSGVEYTIKQKIPFPGKLTKMSKIESLEAEIQKYRYLIMKNQFIKKICEDILDYYYNHLTLKLNEVILEKLKILVVSNQAKLSTGQSNLSDYTKSLVLEKMIKNQNIVLISSMSSIQEKLNYYYLLKDRNINQNYFESTKSFIEERYNENQNFNDFIKLNLDYQIIQLMPLIEIHKKALQKYENYTDFEIFFSYMKRKNMINILDPLNSKKREPLMSLGISFRIPVLSLYSNSKEIESRDHNIEKSNWERINLENELRNQFSRLRIQIQSLEDRLKNINNILLLSEASYDASLQSYRAGKVDFDSIIMVLMNHYELRKEKINLEKELLQSKLEYLEIINKINE